MRAIALRPIDGDCSSRTEEGDTILSNLVFGRLQFAFTFCLRRFRLGLGGALDRLRVGALFSLRVLLPVLVRFPGTRCRDDARGDDEDDVTIVHEQAVCARAPRSGVTACRCRRSTALL